MKSIQSDFNKLPLCVELLQSFQGCAESANTVDYSFSDDEVLDVLEDSEILAAADQQTMQCSDVLQDSYLIPLSFDEDVINDAMTSHLRLRFLTVLLSPTLSPPVLL
ncbi:unnamed protein product [Cuscuta epithymum]|uniref:Uncharacterized protein n=1 Tax=Cuscuta epithymum TaxID=186058 RepID=A0AAV0BV23_9ASTE|nr:unnamed protein product [Cuscuta epithymum]